MGKSIGLILALKDQCSPQITKVAQKLGITEKEAKKLHTQVQKLSKDINSNLQKALKGLAIGAGVAVGAVSGLVLKAGETCDRIDDLSNKIGISRQGFQEWDYLLGQNGAKIESLQMGMKTLVNQIDGVTKGNKNSIATFRALGVSVKDSSGKLKNQEQVFNDVVNALQKMPDGAKKAKLANDLLGRSGSELMPLFNASTEQLAKQREEYKKLGIAISDEVIDAGNQFGDILEKLKSIGSSYGAIIGGEMLPVVNELGDLLIDKLPKIRETLVPVLTGMANAVKFLIDHFDGLSTIATVCLSSILAYKAISGIITTIQTLQNIIKAVSVAQGVWNALMIANPIGLVAVGIGLLIGGIVLLAKNWDKVTGAVKKAVDAMKSFIGIKPKSDVKVDNVEVKKNALGTSFSTGGLTLVGEHGAELVNMPRGASVMNANNTSKALSGGKNDNITIVIQGNVIGNDEFLNKMAQMFAQKLQVAMAVQ